MFGLLKREKLEDEVKKDLYLDPKQADGPKGGAGHTGNWDFRKKKVIWNTGPGGYAIAVGECKSDSPESCGTMLAIRWNGSDGNTHDIGHPKAGTGGQWQPIPRELAGALLARIKELKELEAGLREWPDVTS